MHHTLGVPGGARGEEHGAHIRGLYLVDFGFEKVGVLRGKHFAGGHQFVHRGQPGFVVIAQTTWVIKVDVGQLRAFVANLQQLVDLLLVFGKGKTDFGVVDGKYAFQCGRILVQRNRNRTQRLRCQHGGIQAGPVGTQHDQMLTLA